MVVAAMLFGTLTTGHTAAITVSEYGPTSANGEILSFTGSGSQADPYVLVEELYGGSYVVEFWGMPQQGNPANTGHSTGFWLKKEVRNHSRDLWQSFDNELWETVWVPSSDGDGLSFAQGYDPRPFSSDRFPLWKETDDVRDYVNFYGGMVDSMESVIMNMIITDHSPIDVFYLHQRPNKPPPGVPEPVTLILLGAGLLAVGFGRKFVK